MLDTWLSGAQALSLLSGALRLGLLDAANGRTRNARDLARHTRAPLALTETYCEALVALGIFATGREGFRLEPGFAELLAPDAPVALADLLAGQDAARARLEDPLGRPEPPLAVARSVWGAPDSPAALASFAALDEQLPEVRDLWLAGARHVELGCGLGRHLLRIPVMYPQVTAVGIERDRKVAASARAEVRRLGLGRRAQIRCEDATAFTTSKPVDTLFWSQLFFPAPSRDRVLRRAREALRLGGLLLVPVIRDLSSDNEERTATSLRNALYAARGLPLVPPAKLKSELKHHGFNLVAKASHLRLDYLVFTRR